MDLNKIKNHAKIIAESGGRMMTVTTADVCELVDLVERQEKELAAAHALATPASAPEASEREGWKLVPIEPTPEMLDKAGRELSMNDESAGAAECDLEYQADAHTAYAAMIAAAPLPPVVERKDGEDSARLDWLDQQGYAYGFEDMHEGNRWMIDGPFANLRKAIDAARPTASGAAGQKGGSDA